MCVAVVIGFAAGTHRNLIMVTGIVFGFPQVVVIIPLRPPRSQVNKNHDTGWVCGRAII